MPEVDVNKKRNDSNARIDLGTYWKDNKRFKNPNNTLLPYHWDEETGGVSSKKPDSQNDLFVPIGKSDRGYFTFDLSLGRDILAGGNMLSGIGMFRRVALLSLLKTHSPEALKVVIIDPNGIMTEFDGIPLLLFPRVTTLKDCVETFAWLQKETGRRTDFLGENKSSSVWHFNKRKKISDSIVPSIVVFICELGDLTAIPNFDTHIYKIAGLTRATGIHFIITTQQPSEGVVTPIIRETFANRIAFQMPYEAESKLFIDEAGAEELLGQGDMLFKDGRSNEVIRLQGLHYPVDQTKDFAQKLTL